jgi:hypothetical protein
MYSEAESVRTPTMVFSGTPSIFFTLQAKPRRNLHSPEAAHNLICVVALPRHVWRGSASMELHFEFRIKAHARPFTFSNPKLQIQNAYRSRRSIGSMPLQEDS